MNEKIELDSIVSQNDDINSTDIDGQAVMMNIEKGKYYGFNDVGTRIWEIIKNPVKVEEIINILIQEFDVKTEICKETVVEFLNKLYEERLLIIK